MASADKSSGAMAEFSVVTLNEVAEVPQLLRYVQTQLTATCAIMAVVLMGTSACAHIFQLRACIKELSKNGLGIVLSACPK
jgi:hypothetical protein